MNVTFLLFEGFSNLIFSCLLEPLRVVQEEYQEDIRWQVVTVDNGPVKSSSGMTVLPNANIRDIDSSEMLVIISSNGYRQHPTSENQRLVMALARQSRIIIGADAGAWLLAETGLLDDLTATLHWSVQSDFAETFPQVYLSKDSYVREGRFWSCGGASTALDLILDFISERFGAVKAFTASSMFMHDASLEDREGHMPTALSGLGGSKLHNIMNIMVETIEHPLPLSVLAERTCLSSRTLNRLFKTELGVAPGHYYQSIRLARAKELAETTSFDLREIALRCGYCDAAALSKAFKKAYGKPVRRA